jgi:hypothetical protein
MSILIQDAHGCFFVWGGGRDLGNQNGEEKSVRFLAKNG